MGDEKKLKISENHQREDLNLKSQPPVTMSKLYLEEKGSDGAENASPPALNPAVAVGSSASGGGASLNDTSNLPPSNSYEKAVLLAAPNATTPPIVIGSGQDEEAEETTDDFWDFCSVFWSEPASIGCVAAWLVCSCIAGGLGIIIGMYVLKLIAALFFHDDPTKPEIILPLIIIGGVVIFLAILVICICIEKKSTNNNEGNNEERPPKRMRSRLYKLVTIFALISLGLCIFVVIMAFFGF